MTSDVAFLEIAPSVSAAKAISAPKALKYVVSAADKAAESDKNPLASVVHVEYCVFERCDVVCQHRESRLPERSVLQRPAHDETEVDPTLTMLLETSQKERAVLNRAGIKSMSRESF